MSASVSVEGIDKLRLAVKKYKAEVQKRIMQALGRGAIAIQKDAILEIAHGDKTGEIYGRHQASAPGEAPATDTGKLVSGIRVIKIDEKTVSVVSKAPYSFDLEFGTMNMEARPFLGPAWKKNLPQIKKDYEDAVRGAG